jgi:anti-sigma factor RsiW
MSGHGTTAGGEHCEFEHDDGAYILGALSPAERAEFERHLAQCPPCRRSLADLAVLPGLLGRLNTYPPGPSRVDAASGRTGAAETLLPRLLTTASRIRGEERRAQRRRQVRVAVSAIMAAAAVAAAVGVGVHVYDRDAKPALFAVNQPTPSPQPSFAAMWANPDAVAVDAQIALSPVEGGTLISVRCHHTGNGSRSWALWLVVYPRNEEAEPIGSWVATPGQDLSMTGLTHYTPDKIDRIEVQDYHQTTLLWWRP